MFFCCRGLCFVFGLLASERERERERSLFWRSDHRHHHPSSFGEGLGVDEGSSSSVLEDAKQIVLHL